MGQTIVRSAFHERSCGWKLQDKKEHGWREFRDGECEVLHAVNSPRGVHHATRNNLKHSGKITEYVTTCNRDPRRSCFFLAAHTFFISLGICEPRRFRLQRPAASRLLHPFQASKHDVKQT